MPLLKAIPITSPAISQEDANKIQRIRQQMGLEKPQESNNQIGGLPNELWFLIFSKIKQEAAHGSMEVIRTLYSCLLTCRDFEAVVKSLMTSHEGLKGYFLKEFPPFIHNELLENNVRDGQPQMVEFLLERKIGDPFKAVENQNSVKLLLEDVKGIFSKKSPQPFNEVYQLLNARTDGRCQCTSQLYKECPCQCCINKRNEKNRTDYSLGVNDWGTDFG